MAFGRADLDHLAGPHALPHDAHRDLARGEIDGGAAGLLVDGEGRELAHRHEGLAAEQHAHDRLLGGGDAVAKEDVVLEAQRLGAGQGGARDRDRTGQRRHDADAAAAVARGLGPGQRGPDGEEQQRPGSSASSRLMASIVPPCRGCVGCLGVRR